ncbi:MAG: transglutaminase family protein [Armatimonadota bacterium]
MRTFARAVIPAGVGIVALALAWSALNVDPPPSSEELERLVGTQWYSVRVMGQPNGYACIQTDLVDGAEGARLRVTEDLRIMISLGGRELEASKSQVTVYDALLRPASIELVKDELGRASRLSARLEGETLIVRTGSPEPGGPPPKVQQIAVPADLTSDLVIPIRLLRGELDVGDRFELRVYDPEVEVLDRHIVSVERRESLGDTDTLVINARSEALGVEVLSWIDGAGVLLRQTVPGLMELTLERVTEEEALASLAPFEIKSQIPVAEHLPLVRSLREVTLRVRRTIGSAVELIPATGRQRVVAEADDAVVTIARERPPQESPSLPIGAEELAPYLQPTKHVQSDHPRIVQTAREVIGAETDAWAAAQLLCTWVHERMGKVSSEPRPITALEALEEMQGDCTEHAILLAALGRAVGLPTRLVTGLAYVGGKFGYHAWTEVYVGRWVEMDPAWGEITADAGHLVIYSTALDEASYARASLATGRTIGAIEIDLLGYVAADGREVRFGEAPP